MTDENYFDSLKALIVLLAALLFCCSCGCGRKLTGEVRDSTLIEYRESVVYVPDTVYLEIPAQTAVRETEDSTSELETDYAMSTARINKDGSLYHDLRNKAQKKPMEVKTKIVYRDTTVYKTRREKITETKEVEKKLAWWQIFFMWAGALSVGALIAFILIKVKG